MQARCCNRHIHTELITFFIGFAVYNISAERHNFYFCLAYAYTLCLRCREYSPITHFARSSQKCYCKRIIHVGQHFVLIKTNISNSYATFAVVYTHKSLFMLAGARIIPASIMTIISRNKLKYRICTMYLGVYTGRHHYSDSMILCPIVKYYFYFYAFSMLIKRYISFYCKLDSIFTSSAFSFFKKYHVTLFVLKCFIACFGNCYCICNLINSSERFVLYKLNFSIISLCCYRLCSFRHLIHILVTYVACFFIITDTSIYSAAHLIGYVESSVAVYLHAYYTVFHTVFACDKCFLCIYITALCKRICSISHYGYILCFKSYTHRSCHIRLSELILR